MKGMTRQAAECLLQACGDIVPLFDESPERWREILDANAPLFDAEARQKALAAADREMEFIEKKNITPIFLTDPDYPSLCEQACRKAVSHYSESSVAKRYIDLYNKVTGRNA